MIFGHDLTFWVAIVFAALFKVRTSEERSWGNVVFTFAASIFAAWATTDAVLTWLNLDPETYKVPIGVIIGLIGESLMKRLTSIDVATLDKAVKYVVGKGRS